ncbi:MAG: spore coat protein [Bacillota bacterium]|nr:spore coat protein [Bacillota bacterium]
MNQKRLSPNESLKLHEMLNFKTVCMTSSKLMEGVVFDQELKTLLERDVQQSVLAVNDLQNMLKKAPDIKLEV